MAARRAQKIQPAIPIDVARGRDLGRGAELAEGAIAVPTPDGLRGDHVRDPVPIHVLHHEAASVRRRQRG